MIVVFVCGIACNSLIYVAVLLLSTFVDSGNFVFYPPSEDTAFPCGKMGKHKTATYI